MIEIPPFEPPSGRGIPRRADSLRLFQARREQAANNARYNLLQAANNARVRLNPVIAQRLDDAVREGRPFPVNPKAGEYARARRIASKSRLSSAINPNIHPEILNTMDPVLAHRLIQAADRRGMLRKLWDKAKKELPKEWKKIKDSVKRESDPVIADLRHQRERAEEFINQAPDMIRERLIGARNALRRQGEAFLNRIDSVARRINPSTDQQMAPRVEIVRQPLSSYLRETAIGLRNEAQQRFGQSESIRRIVSMFRSGSIRG